VDTLVLVVVFVELFDHLADLERFTDHTALHHAMETVQCHGRRAHSQGLREDQPESMPGGQHVQRTHGVQNQGKQGQLVQFGVQFDQGHENVSA